MKITNRLPKPSSALASILPGLLTVSLLLAGADTAQAGVDIRLQGADGAAGADGAGGNPGTDGGAGAAGEDIVTSGNLDTDPDNWYQNRVISQADGGAGGNGGAGGDGSVAGADGGNGGDGGAGGNAAAYGYAPTEGGTLVYGDGGDGGNGGAGGLGSGGGSNGSMGNGGDGGSGYAYSLVVPNLSISGFQDGSVGSYGGNGGDGANGGAGGTAESFTEATGSVVGSTIGGWAFGGDGGSGLVGNGGTGGDATITLQSVVTKGQGRAEGGHGGDGAAVGGDGGNATAIGINLGAPREYYGQNFLTMTATGGNGGTSGTGTGGQGGAALSRSAVAIARGGNGGGSNSTNGGDGGSALADATPAAGDQHDYAKAVAYGGDGGYSTGVAGGTGGNGEAQASGQDRVDARANAGDGGLGLFGGDGGAAGVATAVAHNTGGGSGDVIVGAVAGYEGTATLLELRYQSFINSPSGKGGDVQSGSGNTAGAGADVYATAINDIGSRSNAVIDTGAVAAAGNGGNVMSGTGFGGAGGDAYGTVELEKMPATDVNNSQRVWVRAAGGNGGEGRGAGFAGGAGGSAIASVDQALSEYVTVELHGGNGGAGLDAADGGLGGSVAHDQTASFSIVDSSFYFGTAFYGGAGGASAGGTAANGGQATTNIDYNVTGAASVSVSSRATSGDGGAGSLGSDGASSGAVSGSVRLVGETNVSSTLTLVTGNGGDADGGGQAGSAADIQVLDSVIVNAISTGDGAVKATLLANSGDTSRGHYGHGGNATGGSSAGDGSSAMVRNAVDASTGNGFITLKQSATGGQGGSGTESSVGAGDAAAGNGGDAYSELSRIYHHSAGISLETSASGSWGGELDNATGKAGNAGSGQAIATLQNDIGAASVKASAYGSLGGAGYNGASSGDGGSADAYAQALTQGDNHDALAEAFATAGYVDDMENASATSVGGRGGDAISLAEAMSAGNSAATAYSEAKAGAGGQVNTGSSLATNGAGGDARAEAYASNSGSGLVTAGAKAVAGGSGDTSSTVGSPALATGSALAIATGVGNGTTNVNSEAYIKRSNIATDLATARSTATGTAGMAESLAGTDANIYVGSATPGYGLQTVTAIARSPVNGTVNTEATVGMNGAAGTPALNSGLQAQAHMIGLPVVQDVVDKIQGHTELQTGLGQAVNTAGEVLGYGQLGATHSTAGSGAETYESVVGLTLNRNLVADPENILLGLIDAEILGNGFESLTFTIGSEYSDGYVGGDGVDILGEYQFTDVAAAEAFFTDNLIDVGELESFNSIHYGWDTSPGSLDVVKLWFTLSLVTMDVGDGFGFDMVIANSTAVPLPPALWMFVSALACMVLGGSRRKVVCRLAARS